MIFTQELINMHPYFSFHPAKPRINKGFLNHFTCTHCSLPVSLDPEISGVNNRNHCPYCLWSKHVDQFSPGDRLSACKSPMIPIGLSLKKVNKKYRDKKGEIVLIHYCPDCHKISINRLAADDDPQQVMMVYKQSCFIEAGLCRLLQENQIENLGPDSSPIVESQLFGRKIFS
jgi:hypothetical protein